MKSGEQHVRKYLLYLALKHVWIRMYCCGINVASRGVSFFLSRRMCRKLALLVVASVLMMAWLIADVDPRYETSAETGDAGDVATCHVGIESRSVPIIDTYLQFPLSNRSTRT